MERFALPPRVESVPAPEIVPAAARLRECPNCGQFYRVPRVPPGGVARCLRCNAVLRRGRRYPVQRPLAFALAGLVLLAVAAQTPMLGFEFYGRSTQIELTSGPVTLDNEGLWELGVVVLATTLAVPLARLLAVIAVLAGLHMRSAPKWLPLLFAWAERLRPWAMIEVYLLGVLVAYSRLVALAQVEIGPGIYALGGVMLAIAAADAALDPDQVWETLQQKRLVADPAAFAASSPAREWRRPAGPGHLVETSVETSVPGLIGCDRCRLVVRAVPGERCPRCDAVLRHRKPNSINRTWALLLAATILYIPANTLPIMTVLSLGQATTATIASGVQELADRGMWPLAALVFFASITVPVLKVFGLGIMLLAVHYPPTGRLRDRTALYRMIETIGRWSMIDVFMLSVLVGLVRMGYLASVRPGLGAVAFCAVVILTMLAAMSFDPRLMWDAAAARRHR
jgi:paraquat-inducible protein A